MKFDFPQLTFVFTLGTALAMLAGCRPALIDSTSGEVKAAEPKEIVGATAQYIGIVMSPAAKPFVIMSDDGMKHSFEVIPATKVTIDGRAAKLEMVKSGDHAAVTGDTHQRQVVATLIEVESTHSTQP